MLDWRLPVESSWTHRERFLERGLGTIGLPLLDQAPTPVVRGEVLEFLLPMLTTQRQGLGEEAVGLCSTTGVLRCGGHPDKGSGNIQSATSVALANRALQFKSGACDLGLQGASIG